MKYTLTLAFLTSAAPALAHSGPHMHPHSVEGWVVGIGLIALAGAAVVAFGRRK